LSYNGKKMDTEPTDGYTNTMDCILSMQRLVKMLDIDCEKITDVTIRKQCFFEFMANEIQQKLSVDTLAILFPKLDTIEVKVTIFSDATLQFEPQFPRDSIAYDTIKIDSILRTKLVDFPKINPAIKRGIPVKTQFVLPVIIKTEK
jgi:hypothetical protein